MVWNHLIYFGSNESLPDKALSHKLPMLLALTTANRSSDIYALDPSLFQFFQDRFCCHLEKLTKSRRVGQKALTVDLFPIPDSPRLCVVKCVQTYLYRSASWRVFPSQKKQLLLSFISHKPVVYSTVTGWLKQLMQV